MKNFSDEDRERIMRQADSVRVTELLKQRASARARFKRKWKGMTPQERQQHQQTMLWHKLHSIFTRKEYVTHDSLPEKLKEQVAPFEEITYPSAQ